LKNLSPNIFGFFAANKTAKRKRPPIIAKYGLTLTGNEDAVEIDVDSVMALLSDPRTIPIETEKINVALDISLFVTRV
jgi:hypothetical protein